MCERVKCGSLQAAELDRRALHELGESVLSALSQPSATLLCSSLGFPAGRSQYGLGRVGAGTAFGLRQAERPPLRLWASICFLIFGVGGNPTR